MWSTVKGTRVVVNSQPPVDTSRGSTGSGDWTICNKEKRTERKCHDSNQVRDGKLNRCSAGSAQNPWGTADLENKTGEGCKQLIDHVGHSTGATRGENWGQRSAEEKDVKRQEFQNKL